MKNEVSSSAVRKEINTATRKKQVSKTDKINLEAKLLIGAVILGAFVLAFYCSINGQL